MGIPAIPPSSPGATKSFATASPRPGSRLFLVGDSNTQRNFVTGLISASGLSRTSNVATVVTSGLSNLFQGCPFYIGDVPASFAGNYTMSTVSGGTFTYANPGPDIAPFTPVTGPFPRVTDFSKYSAGGAINWGNSLAFQKFDIVGISANTGRLTGEMVTRMTEILSVPSDAITLLGGTNNNGVTSVAQTFSDLLTIVNFALTNGRKVIWATVPPRTSPSWSASNAEFEIELNKLIRHAARSMPGVYLWDIYKRLVDPVNANKGAGVTNYFVSDGLHFSDEGAFEAGDEFNITTSSWPFIDFRTSSNADNYGTNANNSNYWDFAPWTATGAAAPTNGTGVVASGFQGAYVNGTPGLVWSVPARTVAADGDAVGFNNQVVVTPAAVSDQFQLFSNVSWVSRMPAGVVLQGDSSIAVTNISGSNLQFIAFSLALTIGGVTGRLSAMAATNNSPITKNFKAVFRTPPVALTTLPTAGFSQLLVGYLNSGTAMTIGTGRWEHLDPTK